MIAVPDEEPRHLRAALWVAVTVALLTVLWAAFGYNFGFDLLMFGPRLRISPTVSVGLVVGSVVGMVAAIGSGRRRGMAIGSIALVGVLVLGTIGNLTALAAQRAYATNEALTLLDDREYLVTFFADDVLDDARAEGRDVPGPVTDEDRSVRRRGQYTAEIWEESLRRFDATTDAERETFLARRRAALQAAAESEMDGPWSLPRLTFLVLAGVAAYAVGWRGRLGSAEV